LAYKFNPFTGKLDYYEAAVAAGDAWGDPVDASIIPASNSTYDLGSTTRAFNSLFLGKGSGADQVFLTVDDNSSVVARFFTDPTTGIGANTGIGMKPIQTGDSINWYTETSATGTATGDIIRSTGNNSSIGNSGNIIDQPGTSTSGDRGYIYHNGRIINANQSANGTTTITPAIRNVYSSTGASDIVLTLPAAIKSSGSTMTFVKIDSGAGTVEIDGDGSETIGDGTATSFFLHHQTESVTLFSTGTEWMIVGRHIPSIWTSFTPTGGFTNTTYEGEWKRVGDSVMIQVKGTLTGTPATANLSLNMPTGMTIDTAKLSGTAGSANLMPSSGILGVNVGTSYHAGVARYSTTSTVVFSNDGALATWSQAAPFTWVSGDVFTASFNAPVTGWEG
jgi:hypothetical protein